MLRRPISVFVILLTAVEFISALFFPASSVFQITVSISVPVIDLPPERRVSFDWGMQMNHDMPFELASFYSVPIWPELWGNSNVSARALAYDKGWTEYKAHLKYLNLHRKYTRRNAEVAHYQDFTAGELYSSLEQLLVSYGFDATCLPRSVCELARHPFADRQTNLLTDMVNLLLTPSLHMGFTDSELLQRRFYESAELRGFLGENCTYLYDKCELNVLSIWSKVIF